MSNKEIETIKVTTLEELLKLVDPKKIFVLLEVKPGHTFDDVNLNGLNVDRLSKILDRIEGTLFENRDSHDDLPIIDNMLVFHRGTPEHHAQPMPPYGFIDKKGKWPKVFKYDLVLIDRLDGKVEVVKLPPEATITDFTLLN